MPVETIKPYLVSAKDAAALLNISDRKLRYLVAEKQIPAVRIGRRVMFRPMDLEKFTKHCMEVSRKIQ